MRTALFVSPHLDDVAFSCGGLAALLADRGWHTVLLTVFTKSVAQPTGFALACQLDKGLPADADYMAIRREEDLRAAAILSFAAIHWLDLPEAPHRGYETAAELFGAVRSQDTIAGAVLAGLSGFSPDLVLAPQCLGNHVDHQLVAYGTQQCFAPGKVTLYRDTPYAMRQPQPDLAKCGQTIDIAAALDRKIAASCAYTSQIDFQFGGAQACAQALAGFALREGGGVPAERFAGAAIPARD